MKKLIITIFLLALCSNGYSADKRITELPAQSAAISPNDLILNVNVSDTTDMQQGRVKKQHGHK